MCIFANLGFIFHYVLNTSGDSFSKLVNTFSKFQFFKETDSKRINFENDRFEFMQIGGERDETRFG